VCAWCLCLCLCAAFLCNFALTWKEYKDKTDDDPSNDTQDEKIRVRCGLTFETINSKLLTPPVSTCLNLVLSSVIPTIICLAIAYQKASFFASLATANCKRPGDQRQPDGAEQRDQQDRHH